MSANSDSPKITFSIVLSTKQAPIQSELAKAVFQDLEDVASELALRPSNAPLPDAITSTGAALVVYDNILNPTPSLLEGMLEALEEFDASFGPSVQGGIYGVAILARSLTPQSSKQLCDLIQSESPLSAFVQWGKDFSLNIFWQAPWYQGWDEATLTFALDHMQALDSGEDPEFVALRTLTELARILPNADAKKV